MRAESALNDQLVAGVELEDLGRVGEREAELVRGHQLTPPSLVVQVASSRDFVTCTTSWFRRLGIGQASRS